VAETVHRMLVAAGVLGDPLLAGAVPWHDGCLELRSGKAVARIVNSVGGYWAAIRTQQASDARRGIRAGLQPCFL
jgi:hypothetical protein